MSAVIALGASALVPLGYWATLRAVNGARRSGEPPLVRGAVPYLGVAATFGKGATAYIQRCQAEHGDVFTLFIAGQRLTFVLDPLAVPAVLRCKQLAFRPVSDQILTDAFDLDGFQQQVDYETIEILARTQLRGESLSVLSDTMGQRLEVLVPSVAPEAWESTPLYRTVWEVMFRAGTDALYGAGSVTPQLCRDFELFDDEFPLMASGLPRALVRQGESALHRLASAKLLGEQPSAWIRERQAVLAVLDEHERGLARVPILWAIHANTIPATFWTLYFLLRHPEGLDAVRDEIDAYTGACPLDELRVLDSAINEALRLSSGSMTVRAALQAIDLETPRGTHRLRRGDRVCIAPFITHRDPEVFEQPLEYRYDRFYSAGRRKQFYKRGERVPLPLMPFGAGVSMCPGRFFAINEIKLFMINVVRAWDIEAPTGPDPEFDHRRAGLGIYPPANDVFVRLRRQR